MAESDKHTHPSMTLERAYEINSAMLDFGLRAIGLNKQVAQPSLVDVSLAEMIQCAPIIKEHEDKQPADQPKTFTVVCDDRLVAAIYVSLHFPPDSGSIIVIGEDFASALLLCPLSDKERQIAMECCE